MRARVLSLGLVVGLAAAAPAQAQGFYAGIQGGVTFAEDVDNDGAGGVTVESTQDTGFNVGGMVGYGFLNNVRVEGEIAYRQNDIDELDLSELGLPGIGKVSGKGDVSALSFMANGFYDFDVAWPLKPYVGAGLGFARVSLNDVGGEEGGASVDLADDDDTVFAYQFGAGLAYPLNPTTTISLDYRYFATTDPELKDEFGEEFDSEYRTHNIGLNVRFRF